MLSMKPIAQLQAETDKLCLVPGCQEHVTMFRGPGQELCDAHRGMLKEHGGLATMDKLYSFQRGYICSCCGKDVRDQVKVSYELLYPGRRWEDVPDKMKNEAYRNLMDVDHVDGDHENNDPSNLRPICKDCHGVKTAIEQDSVNRRYKNK
jgi:hypothetical protein